MIFKNILHSLNWAETLQIFGICSIPYASKFLSIIDKAHKNGSILIFQKLYWIGDFSKILISFVWAETDWTVATCSTLCVKKISSAKHKPCKNKKRLKFDSIRKVCGCNTENIRRRNTESGHYFLMNFQLTKLRILRG